MKKILNWTFGGFFRAFGRILCFLVVGGLIAYLITSNGLKLPDILSFGIMKVNAATVNYTYKKYRIQFYSLSQGTSAWTSVEDFGTRQPFSSGYGVSGVSARFGWSSRFQAGTTYRLTLDWGVAPLNARSNYAEVSSYSCYGSTSTSNWSADASLIQTCNLVGTTLVPNGGAIRYIFDITPLQTVIGLQVNAFSGHTDEITGANVYTSSTITYGEDATGAINDQTIIIQDEFEELTNTITEINENLINSITEENQVCDFIDINDTTVNGYMNNLGNVDISANYKTTNYIKITNRDKLKVLSVGNYNAGPNICFFNTNKVKISCIALNTLSVNEFITIPDSTSYFRTAIHISQNQPTFQLCKNGNQALTDELHGIGKGIHDNNTSEATSEASDFFNSFSTNTHGLTSIVTAPLNAITSLSSSTCTPLHLPIPYLDNKYIDLPCMRTIYDENFGSFMNLYDTIIFGIVSYWIIVRIFALVKDFKNPEHDEIEVVDL